MKLWHPDGGGMTGALRLGGSLGGLDWLTADSVATCGSAGIYVFDLQVSEARLVDDGGLKDRELEPGSVGSALRLIVAVNVADPAESSTRTTVLCSRATQSALAMWSIVASLA